MSNRNTLRHITGRRPKAPSGEPAQPRTIRFADDEWATLTGMAREAGCSVGDLIRRKVLGGSSDVGRKEETEMELIETIKGSLPQLGYPAAGTRGWAATWRDAAT